MSRVALAPPTTRTALQGDDLAIWIEQTFGLGEDDEGNLARQIPTRLRDAAGELSALTGADLAVGDIALRDTLLAGSRACDEDGRPLFAFKLHQFIGKGDTAYVTLARPGQRYLDHPLPAQRPGGTAGTAAVLAGVLPGVRSGLPGGHPGTGWGTVHPTAFDRRGR